jgi:hypothetical protein
MDRPPTVTVTLPLDTWLDVLKVFKSASDDAARVSEISKVLQATDHTAKIQRGAK